MTASSATPSTASPASSATLRIASAQLNATVGDLAGNMAKVREAYGRAVEGGADILLLPELFVIGYPPEDLVLKPAAVEDCRAHAETFASEVGDTAVVFSLPWLAEGELRSAVLLLHRGAVREVRFKHHLPNYGVFDERRVFRPGPLPEPVAFPLSGGGTVRLGLPVCEDLWQPGVASHLAARGAEILLSPNGSPWRRTAHAERFEAVGGQVFNEGLPLIYCNQVGGQDELVFDGTSFSLSADGTPVQMLKSFVEGFDIATWERRNTGRGTGQGGVWTCVEAVREDALTGLEADWRACCLGLHDYVTKNGFREVILGLSGGIDSAIVAAICADALGPDALWSVMMPYQWTSSESLEDARACADAIGCRYDTVPIAPAVEAFTAMLEPLFAGTNAGVAEENLQSRIRGVTLMALSNKFGPMLVTTGNKSEMAVGYATLYGDMNGGYNPIKDLYKTEVFALAEWRNAHLPADLHGGAEPIPARIITKPPSAELREDQKDSDSLPPYEVLDGILRGLIEEEAPVETIIARGFDAADVHRVQNLLFIAEYKRRQAPPGVKIGTRNFGRDRRYPITNRYRDTVEG